MIFSELYSVYYRAVARIMEAAMKPGATEQDLRRCVEEEAFSESALTILPALKSGKWPLLKEDLSPVLRHRPTMPLTDLEKRWLKAIADDPRIRLFGVEMPDLDGVEPLFTREDYKVYDQYGDGDPFEDETYIEHFRLIRSAIRQGRPVRVTMENRHGKRVRVRFYPRGFEYSLKDDKIRVLASGCRFGQFNLGRLKTCAFYNGDGSWQETPDPQRQRNLTLLITDRRNALERAMLHFAHFEKRAERTDDGRYILRLTYDADDETELVIRVLSFGPCVRVLEPERFADLIRQRLTAQKTPGLR